MEELYKIKCSPHADPAQIIAGADYRIMVLTQRLIRLEYHKNGCFEDRATQTVLNRDLGKADYRTEEKNGMLTVITEELILEYDGKAFSGTGLCIRMPKNPYSQHPVWYYGDPAETLAGTARTLDEADGEIPLEPGILSKSGFALLDDSRSLALRPDGWVESARAGHTDLYFFGYERDYKGALRDYYRLTGRTPLLPRFALGNWWSRYFTYTADSYLALIDRFAAEKIPFSVAVMDMDWHLVDIAPKYGNGWTGYTWNRELFPDPEGFLEKLHHRGLKITLNVHPAEGVRGYEEAYPSMARTLGVDSEHEMPITFEISDPEFLKAYFEYLHHFREEEGVDFWWIDWQQGSHTGIDGLDPLWMLNHFHYLDNARTGKRPLIFSRYAGPGSHRYPTGFSGDTIISWKSLAFQPYFTACASNIGYGWWSHDIGGHMRGIRDDELAVRWVQFGVFSPVMRLHSSKNEFSGKEPWNYGVLECGIMKEFLRLRHRLIPYLYTMNRVNADYGLPIVRPIYYEYPDREEAYQPRNEYFFGTMLLVNPITEKMNPDLKAGCAKTWLPDGIWYDFFCGRKYRGGRWIKLYRGLETMPVLAKAGGIVPMAGQNMDSVLNGTGNPETLEILVFLGADGSFTLYEDDGESLEYENGAYAETGFRLDWAERRFEIGTVIGDCSVIPKFRTYMLRFAGAEQGCVRRVLVNGEETGQWERRYDGKRNCLTVRLQGIGASDRVCVIFDERMETAGNGRIGSCRELLNRAQISYDVKETVYRLTAQYLNAKIDAGRLVCELQTMEIGEELRDAVYEIVFA